MKNSPCPISSVHQDELQYGSWTHAKPYTTKIIWSSLGEANLNSGDDEQGQSYTSAMKIHPATSSIT